MRKTDSSKIALDTKRQRKNNFSYHSNNLPPSVPQIIRGSSRMSFNNEYSLQGPTPQKAYDLETESKFINKNLTTLGRVFAILSNRKLQKTTPVPPYRECKLTRLLQSSLQYGDTCRTLMIVTACSKKQNSQQSKESLEFAEKAMVAF